MANQTMLFILHLMSIMQLTACAPTNMPALPMDLYPEILLNAPSIMPVFTSPPGKPLADRPAII